MESLRSKESDTETERVYSLCFFDRQRVAQGDEFIEAQSDADALNLALSIRPWMTREVWFHHRLVEVLPPNL